MRKALIDKQINCGITLFQCIWHCMYWLIPGIGGCGDDVILRFGEWAAFLGVWNKRGTAQEHTHVKNTTYCVLAWTTVLLLYSLYMMYIYMCIYKYDDSRWKKILFQEAMMTCMHGKWIIARRLGKESTLVTVTLKILLSKVIYSPTNHLLLRGRVPDRHRRTIKRNTIES